MRKVVYSFKNKETNENVTFITVRAANASKAISQVIEKELQHPSNWEQFEIAHHEGKEIYTVRASSDLSYDKDKIAEFEGLDWDKPE